MGDYKEQFWTALEQQQILGAGNGGAVYELGEGLCAKIFYSPGIQEAELESSMQLHLLEREVLVPTPKGIINFKYSELSDKGFEFPCDPDFLRHYNEGDDISGLVMSVLPGVKLSEHPSKENVKSMVKAYLRRLVDIEVLKRDLIPEELIIADEIGMVDVMGVVLSGDIGESGRMAMKTTYDAVFDQVYGETIFFEMV